MKIKYIPRDYAAGQAITAELAVTFNLTPQNGGSHMELTISPQISGGVLTAVANLGVSYLSVDGDIRINEIK